MTQTVQFRVGDEYLEILDGIARERFQGNRSEAVRALIDLGDRAWAIGVRHPSQVSRVDQEAWSEAFAAELRAMAAEPVEIEMVGRVEKFSEELGARVLVEASTGDDPSIYDVRFRFEDWAFVTAVTAGVDASEFGPVVWPRVRAARALAAKG